MWSAKPNDPADLTADVRERARRVRLAAFDVDGVLTDGRLSFLADGSESKAFHVQDGLGLKLLRQSGISIAWITARRSAVVEHRARELDIDHLCQGEMDKLARLGTIARELGASFDEVAYMGDDLPDLACLSRVGLAIAPANAHPWIAAQVHWQTRLAGGAGAVREACDLILAARGDRSRILAAFRGDGAA